MKPVYLSLLSLPVLAIASGCSKTNSNSGVDAFVGVYKGTMHSVASSNRVPGYNPYAYDTTYETTITVNKISPTEIEVLGTQLKYSGSNTYTASDGYGIGGSWTATFDPAAKSMHYQYSWNNPGGTAITNESSDFVGNK